MIRLTREPIDTQAILDSVRCPEAGAVVLFLGTTRELTKGRRTLWLDYEGYEEMAIRQLENLEQEARARWPIEQCVIVHRLGRVDLSEASVAVAVSTGHRRESFEAGQWLIDRLKEVAPIWKQEHWEDGSAEWIHPGADLRADAEEQL
ncbi:MAG: molybdenum cofactor biosynthesis protein MoaE [Planctomycetales bacterium]|nr:molybdenum cofactor biosynthesis protein MoaE [Planctomycetales bacterium]